jgi:cytochrome c peroxidase
MGYTENKLSSMKTISLISLILFISACSGADEQVKPPEEFRQNLPAGFPELPIPSDNPMSVAKIELGRHLFHERRISKDFRVSCATCHNQPVAFTDARRKSVGFGGDSTFRNALSLANVAYNPLYLWDGGVRSLEVQALGPIVNANEMNMRPDSVEARLRQIPKYAALFRNAWGDDAITIDRVTKSIAAFERTFISANSAFDRWQRGDLSALNASAQRGVELFFGEKGDCWHCHGQFNLTTFGFHNNAIDSVSTRDEGRYRVTNAASDIGKFKTPTLRNVALTAPYMHDGRFQTLNQVLRHYNSGGLPHPNKDPLMRPLGLSEQEIQDIIAFLNALSDPEFISNPAFQAPMN